MKAAVLHTFGQAPKYESFADPVPGEGEVLVTIKAAGLHPIVKGLAAGTHYLSTTELPFVVGLDAVGVLKDGSRVFCAGPRKPFGTFAELAAVSSRMCIPLPDGINDATAAAIANPGMSAWLALTWKANLQPGETVLILGATGVAGKLAAQMARHLGAGRIIAAGRNPASLERLSALGVDAVISLDQPHDALVEAFTREAGVAGLHVVIDYLWGAPTQALFTSLAKASPNPAGNRIRHVEVGQSAGPTVAVPGDLLRSSGLEISGSGFGSASIEKIFAVIPELFKFAATGLVQVETVNVPLTEVEAGWSRSEPGARIVFLP